MKWLPLLLPAAAALLAQMETLSKEAVERAERMTSWPVTTFLIITVGALVSLVVYLDRRFSAAAEKLRLENAAARKEKEDFLEKMFASLKETVTSLVAAETQNTAALSRNSDLLNRVEPLLHNMEEILRRRQRP